MSDPQQHLANRLEKLIATDNREDARTIGDIVCANASAILAALRESSSALAIGGLSLSFHHKSEEIIPSDLWLNFKARDGKSVSYSVAALAERSGHVIGAALRAWAGDRIADHESKADIAPTANLIEEHARVAEGVIIVDGYRCDPDGVTWDPDSAYGHGRSDAAKAILATASEPVPSADSRESVVEAAANALEDEVTIDYTNYRGERALRRVILGSVKFTSNEWYPEKQWLITAFDIDRNLWRDFAMRNIHGWKFPALSRSPKPATDGDNQ
jgi:hypothetical protein